jgi:thioredoxin 1
MHANGIVHVDQRNFQAEVLGSERPVLLDFGAAWCGPCRALAPIAASIAEEYAGRLKVATIDADDSPEIVARYGVRAMPTLIVMEGGREVRRHVGLLSRQRLIALFEDRL